MKETWRPVVGYEGLYEVSSYGRVRSLDRYETVRCTTCINHSRFRSGRLLKLLINGNIPVCVLCKDSVPKPVSVCKLVAESFIPNPNQYDCVLHKDGNKSNNHLDNLTWAPTEYICGNNITDEVWRPIPYYEDLYEVSNTGRVRSIRRVVTRVRKRGVDFPKFTSKELKPYSINKTSGAVKYHLHRRYKPGYYGQTDEYRYAEDLVREAFPELYKKEN